MGFVANIRGQASHQMVLDADQMLCHMDHRGACGCEPNTGDGAGILTAMPHGLIARLAKEHFGAQSLDPGFYAAGNVFLPQDESERARCKRHVERFISEYGQRLIGWRELPVDFDAADVGPTARRCAPAFEQLFVEAGDVRETDEFERRCT